MAKLENDTNQVQSPIDIAMQMLAGTQDIIFNAILGPQKTERVDMIATQVQCQYLLIYQICQMVHL